MITLLENTISNFKLLAYEWLHNTLEVSRNTMDTVNIGLGFIWVCCPNFYLSIGEFPSICRVAIDHMVIC